MGEGSPRLDGIQCPLQTLVAVPRLGGAQLASRSTRELDAPPRCWEFQCSFRGWQPSPRQDCFEHRKPKLPWQHSSPPPPTAALCFPSLLLPQQLGHRHPILSQSPHGRPAHHRHETPSLLHCTAPQAANPHPDGVTEAGEVIPTISYTGQGVICHLKHVHHHRSFPTS